MLTPKSELRELNILKDDDDVRHFLSTVTPVLVGFPTAKCQVSVYRETMPLSIRHPRDRTKWIRR